MMNRSGQAGKLTVVAVVTEEETPRGWRYGVRIERGDGKTSEHEVRLAWVDHEYWSGGRLPPSKVVEAVVHYVLAREDERPLVERFDAAAARRWFPAIDKDLRDRL